MRCCWCHVSLFSLLMAEEKKTQKQIQKILKASFQGLHCVREKKLLEKIVWNVFVFFHATSMQHVEGRKKDGGGFFSMSKVCKFSSSFFLFQPASLFSPKRVRREFIYIYSLGMWNMCAVQSSLLPFSRKTLFSLLHKKIPLLASSSSRRKNYGRK